MAPVTPSGLRRAVWARVEPAFRGWVARSDDRRLERTIASAPGLRVLFGRLASSFVPAAAQGFTGELACELRASDGTLHPWTLVVTADRVRARRGSASAARLTIKLSLADFARIAAGDLDPGSALLTGRLDLVGDFELATRLGAMFGRREL